MKWIYAERDAVRAVLIRYGVPRHQAAGVVQEVMYQALRSLPRFKGNSKVRTWLLAVAKNVARSRHRREQRHPTLSLGTPAGMYYADSLEASYQSGMGTPHEDAVRRERRDLIQRALRQLPPHYATIIRLRDLEERSTEEVAEALGTTRGNTRVRLYRARQALKDLLEPHLEP